MFPGSSQISYCRISSMRLQTCLHNPFSASISRSKLSPPTFQVKPLDIPPGPSYRLHTSRFLPHHLPEKVSHSPSSLLHDVKIFSMDTGLRRFCPLLIIPTSSHRCLFFGICTSWFMSLTCYFIPGPLATHAQLQDSVSASTQAAENS